MFHHHVFFQEFVFTRKGPTVDKMEEEVHGFDSSQSIHFRSVLLSCEEIGAIRYPAAGRLHRGLFGTQRRSFFLMCTFPVFQMPNVRLTVFQIFLRTFDKLFKLVLINLYIGYLIRSCQPYVSSFPTAFNLSC